MSFLCTMHRVVDLLIMSSAGGNVPNSVKLNAGRVTRYRDQEVILRVSEHNLIVELRYAPASGEGWVERFVHTNDTAVKALLDIVRTEPTRRFTCSVGVNEQNRATYLQVCSRAFNLTMLGSPQLTIPETKVWMPRVWILRVVDSNPSLYTLDFFKQTMVRWFATVDDRRPVLLWYLLYNTVEVDNAQAIVVDYCTENNIQFY